VRRPAHREHGPPLRGDHADSRIIGSQARVTKPAAVQPDDDALAGTVRQGAKAPRGI
jgi:hypothetical protein